MLIISLVVNNVEPNIIRNNNRTLPLRKPVSLNSTAKKSVGRSKFQSMELNPRKVKRNMLVRSAREASHLLAEFDSENSIIKYTNNSNDSALRMFDANFYSSIKSNGE